MRAIIQRPSTSYDERGQSAIDLLLMHYTGMQDAAGALERLCDPDVAVSAHYLIDEDGTIYQMVDEAHRAWHAGVSYWAGQTDINACSIGIEIVNPGHEWGYRDFPEPQMAAIIELSKQIVARHGILQHRVLGHSDVAPGRKTDPGERFDWRRLAVHDLGIWLDPDDFSSSDTLADQGVARLRQGLAQFGYQVEAGNEIDEPLAAVVRAFHRHYDPARLDQQADGRTLALLQALLAEKQALEASATKA